ncbi:MAG TPA: YncE family protein [Actinomycetota bacterium]|nr:YncE family protein [Actinomycetota bacterium]
MALATTVRQARRAAILAAVVLAAAGCGVHPHQQVLDPPAATANRRPTGGSASPDVYAADRPGRLSPVVRGFPSRVYVPNSDDGTVDVIDPATRRVVDHFATGRLPQHVVPSWDLRTLWVTNDQSNSLTPIDPATGRHGRAVPVADPYNLYFTPDSRFAIVVAERLRRLDFRDPHTMRLRHSLAVPCTGVDHLDFTADGRFLLASCEFSGQLLWVDVRRERVVGVVDLEPGSMPQDVKLAPDGRLFYVADMRLDGVHLVAAARPRVLGFLPTGVGAHGLYVSRDSRYLYVSNRGEGSISVLSFATRKVVATWRLPGGGSPDMGGVSADGRVLWLAGRYHAEVYAIDTRTGALLARVKVGQGPHGLCVYPQPGRYSLGHTGVFR